MPRTLFKTRKTHPPQANTWVQITTLILLTGWFSNQAIAHEFWIEPTHYQIESGQPINASLKNGENFSGTHFSYLPHKFVQFDIFDQSERRSIDSRIGDMLHILAYVSKQNLINYEKFEHFEKFANSQDLAWLLDAHKAKQLPPNNISEVYTRYAKSLIASGHAEGHDANLGLTMELIALTNPYRRETLQDVMRYQLFHNQLPLPDTRIDLFYKSADKAVSITHHRTDRHGIISFSAELPGAYLLSSVVAIEPSASKMVSTGALWETLWASSTFGVKAP